MMILSIVNLCLLMLINVTRNLVLEFDLTLFCELADSPHERMVPTSLSFFFKHLIQLILIRGSQLHPIYLCLAYRYQIIKAL